MPEPATQGGTKPPRKAASAAKKPSGRAAAKKSPSTRQRGSQRAARSRGPDLHDGETTKDAVERALKALAVDVTAKRAVVVATVRRLAEALDLALPTDRPKISKELAARWAELMAEVNPSVDDDDWTKGSGAAPGGHTAEPGPADKR